MRLDGGHKRGKVEVETAGDPPDGHEAHVALAAFDVAHVGAVEADAVGE
jgi:hypothetical protein